MKDEDQNVVDEYMADLLIELRWRGGVWVKISCFLQTFGNVLVLRFRPHTYSS